jgi:hypothetical protein
MKRAALRWPEWERAGPHFDLAVLTELEAGTFKPEPHQP